MTALDHIKRALRMCGVIAETETPDAAQVEAGLLALNGMLAAWEGEGIRMTLPELDLVTALPLPPSHNDAISYGLAMRLAGEYGATVSPMILEAADRTFRALQATYVQVPDVLFDPAMLRPGRGYWGRW